MDFPLVSVIIPAYNGEEHLGDAIQSVLDQTYHNFKIVVVDDASKDGTLKVVQRFDDPRLQCIVQEKNQGPDHARKTGLAASSGEIIAFLDQDDLFHPDKLASHVAFLKHHPDVGFTYNGYFNLNHSSTTVRDVWRPSRTLELSDLVCGFPLPPSTWVLRRNWALKDELWQENTFYRGREIVFCGRLFMAGCRFAMVDKILNYRRYHAGRVFGDLAAKCEAERTCQEIVYADPRCPSTVVDQRAAANANILLLWTFVAFAQEETALGRAFIRDAVRLCPVLLEGAPCELTKFLLVYGVDDETVSHEALLRSIFDQFPPELSRIANQYQWAAAQGYLIKGLRAVMWDREEDADTNLAEAARLGAKLDDFIVQMVTDQLLAYETAFGANAEDDVAQRLSSRLKRFDSRYRIRSLQGIHSVNRAFESYRVGEYSNVAGSILRAVVMDPSCLANRGVLSILARSTYNMWVKVT